MRGDEPMHHGAHQLVEVAPVELEAERARFDARHVQQIAHQAVEPVGFFVDGRQQIVTRGRVERDILLQERPWPKP